MRIEVKSSLLRAVEYDPSTRELTVEFKGKSEGDPGKVYRYANVSQQTYDAFVAAESQGKYFLKEIKPGHACTRVKEEKEDASNQEGKKKDYAPDGDEVPF